MRRELQLLLKTNEPRRLPWVEREGKKLLPGLTFDLQDPFHKESYNCYSHFSVQMYGAILEACPEGKCGAGGMMLHLEFLSFQVVTINSSPINTISSAKKREGTIFSFYFTLPTCGQYVEKSNTN